MRYLLFQLELDGHMPVQAHLQLRHCRTGANIQEPGEISFTVIHFHQNFVSDRIHSRKHGGK